MFRFPSVAADLSNSSRIGSASRFPLNSELLIRTAAFSIHHRPRVLRLVIIGRKGKRNQNRGAAGGFDFGDGRCAGAGNDQIRRGVLLVEIVEEGPHIGLKPLLGIAWLHFLQLPFSPV